MASTKVVTKLADGSTQTLEYSNGTLIARTVVRLDNSKDVFLSNITGQSFTVEHDVYNAAGVLTYFARTHANGSLDSTYVFGSDGAKVNVQYDAAGKNMTSRSIVQADGSSDTYTYTNGVLVNETVTHANKTKDVFLSNINGQSYTAEHDVYNAVGVLTYFARTHANGSLDSTYVFGSDGAKVNVQYDAAGKNMTSRSIVQADGSSDTYTYTNGALVNETVVHANKTKDVFLSNINGQSYTAEHDVYNSAGVLTYFARMHANGSLDSTYVFGSDGAKVNTQYDAAGKNMTSRSIVQADGSSDTYTYTSGVLVNETVVHANKTKDIFLSNITGQSYTAEHDVYNAAGILTYFARTHANGSLDSTYVFGSDGAKVNTQYDAAGKNMTSRSIVQADGSSDTYIYTSGVLVNETVLHANKTKDIFLSNITGQSYTAEHDVDNAAGVLTYFARTHANGSLDSTYVFGSDGAKVNTQYDAAGKNMTSRSIVQADGSSDTYTYTSGVLVNETVLHANKTKDIFLSNITGQSYTAEHDVDNAAGILTYFARTHANGSLDSTYVFGSDGAKVNTQYDAAGKNMTSRSIVQADGSSDTYTYTSGVLVNETVLHANKTKDIFLSNITGQSYTAEHDVYDTNGALKLQDYTNLNGSHSQTMYSGSSNEAFTSSGQDTFVFSKGFGNDKISSFNLQTDKIIFDGGIFNSISDALQNHVTDTINGAVLDDGHGDTITFVGENKSQLLAHQSDFQIGAAPAAIQHTYFSNTSAWNTAIDPTTTHYSSPDAIQNLQLRDASLGYSWIQSDNGLLNHAQPNAPHLTWTFDVLNQANAGGWFLSHGSLQLATPANLVPVNGTDADVVFTDPDGIHYWEAWEASYNASTQTWHADYLVEGNLQGTGWGTAAGIGAGIRASGASLLGGLVTADELNSHSINHALTIQLDVSQLKAGNSQYDQFVFPAVSADANSVANYTGSIAMGAHFALPSNLDLDHAGLTADGLALAKAYQQYGGYVVDAAPHTTSIADVDGATTAQLENLRHDATWIRDHLIMI